MMNVRIEIYDGVKYALDAKKVAEVDYGHIDGFEVVTGERGRRIGEVTDGNSLDEYNEYLIIHFMNGETCTFCNSHVELFIKHRY